MAIALFTDFGQADVYVGQIKAVLAREAPGEAVVDLFNDARAFNIPAASHLLAALVPTLPQGTVFIAVVDPGVGGARRPVVVRADGYRLVGPDNGLLSVVAARAAHCEVAKITWSPERLSESFHGRDLFAPVAARIANGTLSAAHVSPVRDLEIRLGARDMAEVIHVDHYGNAITGIRAASLPGDARILAGGQILKRSRVFSEVPAGQIFWYENSLGLVEVAANRANAASLLGLDVGTAIRTVTGRSGKANQGARSRRSVPRGSR